MGNKPKNLNEVDGAIGAGLARAAKGLRAKVGQKLGRREADGDAAVQKAAKMLSDDYFAHTGAVKASGEKVPYSYETIMDYLRKSQNYYPDELAQSQIMKFMKSAGNERLRSGDGEQAPDLDNSHDANYAVWSQIQSIQEANTVASILNKNADAPTSEWADLVRTIAKKSKVSPKQVLAAIRWRVAQAQAKRKPEDAQVPQNGEQGQPTQPMNEQFEQMSKFLLNEEAAILEAANLFEEEDSEEELYSKAKRTVIAANKASTALLQKRLGVDYKTARTLMASLKDNGVIGEPDEETRIAQVIIQPELGDHESDAAATQAAESPGPDGSPPADIKHASSSDSRRAASATQWVQKIEPNLPNRSSPLNRSKIDRLFTIVGADMVRRGLFQWDDQNSGPVSSSDGKGEGSSGNQTPSGTTIDVNKFSLVLRDAGVDREKINKMLDDLREPSTGLAMKNIDSAEDIAFAKAVAVAFAKSVKLK